MPHHAKSRTSAIEEIWSAHAQHSGPKNPSDPHTKFCPAHESVQRPPFAWVTMHLSQDCLCRCARHPAHPARIPPPYIRPRLGQPRPAQELASAPNLASPRRLVCTKPHTRDSHKSMRWRMVAHHALDAGNGQTSGSWPDQQVLAPQPCMGAAPNPRTPPSKGLQTLPFYCQCPDNTADGLTTTPVSIPAPSRQPSPAHTPSATRLALTGLRRACARCAGRPLSAQSLRNAARCVVLNVGA